ncbi:unnamed protein product [Rotaria socialis]|nr:unnamed protein product [Rotaria socialis]
MITEQDGTRNQYFNATTTWKQISSWSKILNGNVETPIDNYNFWNVEQRNLIDEDQTISSTLDQVESTDVDVIGEEEFIDVILSYDKNSQRIHIFRTSPVYSLINNPKYLNHLDLKILPQDCSLVLVKDESEKNFLSTLDIENQISDYASITDKSIHFQITILVQIIRYDDLTEIKIPISHRNITIK